VQLDDDDRVALARACARRFPRAEDQRRFAQVAGLPTDATAPDDATAAWESLLRAADAAGRLPKLSAELAKAAPTDETFTGIARALGVLAAPERSGPPLALIAAVGGAAALLVVVGGAFVLFAGGRDPAPSAAPAAERVTAAPAAPPQAAAEATGAPAGDPAPAGEASAPPAAAPAEAAPPEPPAAAAPPVPAKATPPSAAAPTARSTLPVGCIGAPSGEVIGYWYAGMSSPGAQGETITLDRDARVRADFPRQENHHNASAPERCVLTRGSRFALTRAPIDASNGHWWVPVVAP